MPNKTSQLWNYFDKQPNDRVAVCRFCNNPYSYSSTTGNLKTHLRRRHPEILEHINKAESLEHDEAEEEGASDVWSFFEQEQGRRSRCVVCRALITTVYEEAKAHLKDKHPKLLLQILQDKDSDIASNADDNENTYTEIVYLEQDSAQEESVQKIKSTPKPVPKTTTPRYASKRARRNSSTEEHQPKRNREDDDNELGSFVRYVTCLLKKLPQDIFSKVQVDIINTILNANASAKAAENVPRIVLNSDVPNSTVANMITVNDVTPSNSTILGTHNYTITVGPKDEDSSNVEAS